MVRANVETSLNVFMRAQKKNFNKNIRIYVPLFDV